MDMDARFLSREEKETELTFAQNGGCHVCTLHRVLRMPPHYRSNASRRALGLSFMRILRGTSSRIELPSVRTDDLQPRHLAVEGRTGHAEFACGDGDLPVMTAQRREHLGA